MSCLAYGTPDEKSFTVAVVVSLLGLLVTAFTLGYASIARKHPEGASHAMRVWAIGAAPPMIAVGHAVAAGSMTRTHILDSPLVPLSVFSAFLAPVPFLASMALVFPGKGGLFLELLRATIFIGWLAAYSLVIVIVAGA